MQEFSVVRLLADCSIDTLIGAVAACAAAILLKRLFKLSSKLCLACAFISAAIIASALSTLVLSEEASVAATKAVTSGGVAVALTAFLKKCVFSDKAELKANIEKLLSSIVLSDELDRVVDEIVSRIIDEGGGNEEIKSVILDNLSGEADEESLDKACAFIAACIEKQKENKKENN